MQQRVTDFLDHDAEILPSDYLKYAGTVAEPMEIELDNYLGGGKLDVFSKKGLLKIFPRAKPGISINGVEVNPNNTHGVTQLVARFNVAKEGDKDSNEGKIFKVIEHLISALWAAGVTQADVKTGTTLNFLPVIGPGIEPLYSKLKGNVVHLEDRPLPVYGCDRKVTVQSRLEKSPGKITIEPSTSGKFEIQASATYKDVKGMISSPIRIDDVYGAIEEHKGARPIARIQSQTLRKIHGVLDSLIGIPGVNRGTYIMPDNTPEGNYLGQMHERYQAEGNEHFAHTVYADFFGELHTFFPGKMGAVKITVEGGGHPGRLDMLRQLKDMGILVPVSEDAQQPSRRLIAAE